MQIIAVSNLKGGVGKTTTAHTLAVALSADRRVLLVDADPQGTLTNACGVEDADGRSLAQVLDGVSPRQLRLRQTIRDLGNNLAIVPADRLLAKVESRLDAQAGTEMTLRKALATISPRQGWARPFHEWTSAFFDTVVIDTPPRLGPLTLNALAAADGVLIPIIAESIALSGLRHFLQSVAQVRRTTNPSLQVIGILPTFFDHHLIHHRQALELIRAWDMPLLDITIGRSVRVPEAAAKGETIITFAPTNPRAVEYLVLAEMTRGWLHDRHKDHP